MTNILNVEIPDDLPNDVAERVGFLGYWECDFEDGLVRASESIERLFGCRGSEGESVPLEFYGARTHPDDVAWVARERVRSVGGSGNGVIEYRVIDDQGRVRWLMCRGLYQLDASGNLVHGRGFMIDITAFKFDENSIRTAPAPISNPLNRVVDLAIEAFEAAKQVNNSELLEAARKTLFVAAGLLAKRVVARAEEAEASLH